MKVIVISGKAGHGKDTVAGFIKEEIINRGEKVLIIHYGDLLKFICEKFFGWNGKKDMIGRTLLQYVGTERVRYQRPDYWVQFIKEVLDMFPEEWDYVLIPDARFPNEIEYLRNGGYDVMHLRIVRPGYNILTEEQQKHASETSLDNYREDVCIINDKTLAELKEKAVLLCGKI